MFTADPGEYSAGFGYGSNKYNQWAEAARESEEALMKALTTSSATVGVVSDTGIGTAGDGSRLRVQFLHDVLERASFEQSDAKMMQIIPKEKCYSTTFEWSQFNQYGGAGDGFITETQGVGAAWDISGEATDDTFTRLTRNIKFMVASREMGLVAQTVKNIEDAESLSVEGATSELIAKANLSCYWGNSKTSANQFDGFIQQMLDWITPTTAYSGASNQYGQTQDQAICYDAGGQPVDQNMLNDIMVINRVRYGNASLLVQSAQGFNDTQKLLFPYQRTGMGETNGQMGGIKDKFVSQYGSVDLVHDVMFRPNRPLAADGTLVTGKPQVTVSTVVTLGTLGTVLPAACLVAATPGTGSFWLPSAIRGYAATKPALPSGEGNQGNRLAPGYYVYAVSAVINGVESQAAILSLTGGTSVALTASTTIDTNSYVNITAANSLAKLTVTHGAAGANLGGTGTKSAAKFRVYRSAMYSVNTATTITPNDFDLVGEMAIGTSTSSDFYDNGFIIPGSDNALLMTRSKGRSKAFFLAQLLPMMKRLGLPSKLMSDPLALLLFAAPIMVVPRHHIWIRNIGRAS